MPGAWLLPGILDRDHGAPVAVPLPASVPLRRRRFGRRWRSVSHDGRCCRLNKQDKEGIVLFKWRHINHRYVCDVDHLMAMGSNK